MSMSISGWRQGWRQSQQCQWRGRATTPAAQMVSWMATVMAAHSPRGSCGFSSWRKAFSGFGHILCLEIARPVLCWPDSFLFLMAALMVQAMAARPKLRPRPWACGRRAVPGMCVSTRCRVGARCSLVGLAPRRYRGVMIFLLPVEMAMVKDW